MTARNLSLTLALILASSLAGGQPAVSPQSSMRDSALRSFLQNYVRKAGLDDDKETRYLAAFADLNGDGKEEVIVVFIGRWWCGTGGCGTLVLAPVGSSYRLVNKILLAKLPIRVLASRSHGWNDIGVWVPGGFDKPGHEAVFRFNGTSYPMFGSPETKEKFAENGKGQVVLASYEDAVPLYPEAATVPAK